MGNQGYYLFSSQVCVAVVVVAVIVVVGGGGGGGGLGEGGGREGVWNQAYCLFCSQVWVKGPVTAPGRQKSVR